MPSLVAVAPNLAHKISSYKLIDMTCVGRRLLMRFKLLSCCALARNGPER